MGENYILKTIDSLYLCVYTCRCTKKQQRRVWCLTFSNM